MMSPGVAISVILLLLAGARAVGETRIMPGISDLAAYYDDFQETPSTPTKPGSSMYPNDTEAYLDALQYKQFYDTPYQGLIEGQQNISTFNKKDMRGRNQETIVDAPGTRRRPNQQELGRLAAELQASRRSALSALGMDPSGFKFTHEKFKDTNGTTMWQAGNNPAWANIDDPGVYAHEAAHRGSLKLAEEGLAPMLRPEVNEMMVRRLMATRMGNPSGTTSKIPEEHITQIDSLLADFEARAAKYLAQQDPAGPR
jgi:hypothetical protein